jgi:hypothetical protein
MALSGEFDAFETGVKKSGLFKKMMGGAYKGAVNGSVGASRNTAIALGALGWAKDNWAITTAAVAGLAAVGQYSGSAIQSIPAGPTKTGTRPGATNSVSNYNLGATGDLVFALNRLR